MVVEGEEINKRTRSSCKHRLNNDQAMETIVPASDFVVLHSIDLAALPLRPFAAVSVVLLFLARVILDMITLCGHVYPE